MFAAQNGDICDEFRARCQIRQLPARWHLTVGRDEYLELRFAVALRTNQLHSLPGLLTLLVNGRVFIFSKLWLTALQSRHVQNVVINLRFTVRKGTVFRRLLGRTRLPGHYGKRAAIITK